MVSLAIGSTRCDALERHHLQYLLVSDVMARINVLRMKMLHGWLASDLSDVFLYRMPMNVLRRVVQ